MNCRELNDQLRRPGAGAPGEAALRHAASCPACTATMRAALLLRLGSGRDDDATVRPGFEERLRARLVTEAGIPKAPAWNGGFELLVRPALAVAATLCLLCAGLYVQVSGPEEGGDLASLVETDPVITSVMAVSPDAIFAGPQDAPAGTERP